MATRTSADPRTSKLGSLTTQWTAPPSCETEWLESVVGLASYATTIDAWFRPSMRCGTSEAELDPSCFPTPYGAAVTQMLSRFVTPFFSPGISCPSGWKSDGLTFGTGIPASMGYSLNLQTDETAAMCCPTGWKYGDDLIGCTFGSLTGLQTGQACINGKATQVTVSYTDPRGFSSGVFSASGTTYSVWTWKHVDAIQLVWRSQDLSGQSIATTGGASDVSSELPSRNRATTTAATALSTGPSQNSTNHSGLSTNSKIAIGVAVPVAWFAIFILIGLVLRYRVLQRRIEHLSNSPTSQNAQSTVTGNAQYAGKPELDAPPPVAQGSAYMGTYTPGGQWPLAELPQPLPELEEPRKPLEAPLHSEKYPHK